MKKQLAIDIINDMPQEFNLEELIDRLLFIEKVEQRLEQAEKGETVSHEDVIKHFKEKWAK